MKYCVFSDSHGHPDKMLEAIGAENPAAVLFLGDGERDLEAVADEYPALPLYAVRGNCDYGSDLPPALVCELDGVGAFLTHGHLFGVKRDPMLTDLCEAAASYGAQLALFGHTHEAYLDDRGDLTLLNPGAIGAWGIASYAVVETTDGGFHARLIEI